MCPDPLFFALVTVTANNVEDLVRSLCPGQAVNLNERDPSTFKGVVNA